MAKTFKLNQEDYIILPQGRSRLYFAMHKLGLDERVEKAAQTLGLKLENTAKEQNGRPYIGDINWSNALRLNLALGSSTLWPRQFFDFKEHLEAGLIGQEVYNGKEKILSKKKIEEIYDERFVVRHPFRGEHLDAFFKYISGKMNILYAHRLVKGSLTPSKKETLEPCIMKDGRLTKYVMNRQGLPIEVMKRLTFFYPRNGAVARFGADSGRTGLGCDGDPSGADASLGVTEARKNL